MRAARARSSSARRAPAPPDCSSYRANCSSGEPSSRIPRSRSAARSSSPVRATAAASRDRSASCHADCCSVRSASARSAAGSARRPCSRAPVECLLARRVRPLAPLRGLLLCAALGEVLLGRSRLVAGPRGRRPLLAHRHDGADEIFDERLSRLLAGLAHGAHRDDDGREERHDDGQDDDRAEDQRREQAEVQRGEPDADAEHGQREGLEPAARLAGPLGPGDRRRRPHPLVALRGCRRVLLGGLRRGRGLLLPGLRRLDDRRQLGERRRARRRRVEPGGRGGEDVGDPAQFLGGRGRRARGRTRRGLRRDRVDRLAVLLGQCPHRGVGTVGQRGELAAQLPGAGSVEGWRDGPGVPRTARGVDLVEQCGLVGQRVDVDAPGVLFRHARRHRRGTDRPRGGRLAGRGRRRQLGA